MKIEIKTSGQLPAQSLFVTNKPRKPTISSIAEMGRKISRILGCDSLGELSAKTQLITEMKRGIHSGWQLRDRQTSRHRSTAGSGE